MEIWLKKLGWRLVKLRDVACALAFQLRHRRGDRKPLLLDVGARGGVGLKWRLLQRLAIVDICLVEPEATAAAELLRSYGAKSILPFPLGAVDRQSVTLNLCAEPGVSSIREPDPAVVNRYGFAGAFEIVDRTTMTLRRFDMLVAEGLARQPDFVKIDVQGMEYEVLEGFGDVLDKVLAIELETQFEPLYRGQKLAGDLYAMLLAKGFGLLAIRPQSNFDEFNVCEANFFFARDTRALGEPERRMVELWRKLKRIPRSIDYTLATG